MSNIAAFVTNPEMIQLVVIHHNKNPKVTIRCIQDHAVNFLIEKRALLYNSFVKNVGEVKEQTAVAYTEELKKNLKKAIKEKNDAIADLEDALDCCIASSHIPFVTGNFFNKYKNQYTFDGGVFQNPYYNMLKPSLQITPNMWENIAVKKISDNIEDYTTLLSKEKYNFYDLFENGYSDTKKNSIMLDKIFIHEKP